MEYTLAVFHVYSNVFNSVTVYCSVLKNVFSKKGTLMFIFFIQKLRQQTNNIIMKFLQFSLSGMVEPDTELYRTRGKYQGSILSCERSKPLARFTATRSYASNSL